ncbi:hypothetical protein VCHA57P527_60096 [Vibrio chagasii]|nr:hypothetical protein VCHA57P527_60096 [Vibrio chagasii]
MRGLFCCVKFSQYEIYKNSTFVLVDNNINKNKGLWQAIVCCIIIVLLFHMMLVC